jgi:hypothetical protein
MGSQANHGRIRSKSSLVYWFLVDAQFAVVVAAWFAVRLSSQSEDGPLVESPLSCRIGSQTIRHQH